MKKFNTVGKTNHEIVEHAISLVQEARELIDIVMDQIPNKRFVNVYYLYGEAGLKQAAGDSNPLSISLPMVLEQIEGEL